MRIIRIDSNNYEALSELIKKRTRVISGNTLERVRQIIDQVRSDGDRAVIEFTDLYDGIRLTADQLRVTDAQLSEAYKEVDGDFLRALRKALDNIYKFHTMQKERSWFDRNDGMVLGQMLNPVDSAGVYVPGGTACYPSSVLMNTVPAKVAGVKKIVMVTPPGNEGIKAEILVAAAEAGVSEIYGVGGAQAVAALAYGTESIPAVDKIVGPGNVYVAMAKRLVFGDVGVDMIAGPSEVLVIADRYANPVFAAADMLSQAEHDEMACSILVTDSEELMKKVEYEIEKQLERLPRKETARRSIEDYGALILVKNTREACAVANIIAPEHLELMVREPIGLLGGIRHAGAVFIGDYSPEPLGDYLAGPNHVLPTGGTARFSSPLGVEHFMKKTNLIYYSYAALNDAAEDITKLAEVEGLSAHGSAIHVRCDKND